MEYIEEIKLQIIEKKIQTLLVLFIFFPTILNALGSKALNQTILSFGISIALVIANYLLYEYLGSKISKKSYKYLSGAVTYNIFSFIPLLLIIGLSTDKLSGQFLIYFFSFFLHSIIIVPGIVFVILFIQLLLNFEKKHSL